MQMKPTLRNVLAIAVGVRLASLAVVVAGYYTVPFFLDAYLANFAYPPSDFPTLASAFKTWDGNHYLYLADHGYGPYHISNAYYPLLPFLIRAVSWLTFGDGLVAGLLVANACAVGATAYLYLLVRDAKGEEAAFWACIFLLAFPTAFYLGLVYTESLFLLLAIGLFHHVRRGQFRVAFAFAVALPLVRPTGILVAVAAVLAVAASGPNRGARRVLAKALVPAGFALGVIAYFLVMRAGTGDFWAGFDAQQVFLARNSVANVLHPAEWVTRNFVDVEWTFNGFTTSALDRAAFLWFAGVLVACRRMEKEWWAYMLLVGGVPALMGSLTSYVRYVLVLFPMFICMGAGLRRWWRWAYLAPSAVVQAAFLVLHASNRWIA